MDSRREPKPASNRTVAHARSVSLPAAAVLSFLKETRAVPSWNLKDLTKSLRIGTAEGKRAIALLEVQGYIERVGDDEWLTTDSGSTVSGSKAPRFTQEAVESALAALVERIKTANHNPNAPFHIQKAVAFGDFLTGRARVQAPDVGIQLVPREPEGDRAEAAVGQAARQRFLKQLRGRTPTLAIGPYEEWMRSRTHRNVL